MTRRKNIENENTIMLETFKAMRALGGVTTRAEIRAEIRANSDVIPEEVIDKVRIGKKTQAEYHPWEFDFNFAVKRLILAGFIDTEDNRNLELSPKGRKVDLATFDTEKDVRPISEPLLEKKSAEKKKNKTIEEEVNETPIEEQWKITLLDSLQKMHPQKFEQFCRGLLRKMGIDVDKHLGVQYVADGGIDGFGFVRSDDYRTTRVALQVKRWKDKIAAPEIDKFRGAMDKYNAEFGIFMTTSDFTRDAIKTAKLGSRVITLINGNEICDLVAKYNYYVEPVTTYRLKSFFDEED